MKIKIKFTMWVNKNQINIGIAELKGLILFEFILNFFGIYHITALEW